MWWNSFGLSHWCVGSFKFLFPGELRHWNVVFSPVIEQIGIAFRMQCDSGEMLHLFGVNKRLKRLLQKLNHFNVSTFVLFLFFSKKTPISFFTKKIQLPRRLRYNTYFQSNVSCFQFTISRELEAFETQ